MQYNQVISEIIVDYPKAIQNLTDLLIDDEKFLYMCRNIYDACDTDNEGTISVEQVSEFTRNFMKGNQLDGQINSNFETENEEIFKSLEDNEIGEITLLELSHWLRELLSNQVKMLCRRIEEDKSAKRLMLSNLRKS